MDNDDKNILWDFFKSFDERLISVYERECWKALPKLDKTVRERLGWRRCNPEDQLDRFNNFMDWVMDVYLRPSLGVITEDDCSWSDSGSDSGSYGSIWEASDTEETPSRGEQEHSKQQ